MISIKQGETATAGLPAQINQDTAVQPAGASRQPIPFSAAIEMPDTSRIKDAEMSQLNQSWSYHQFIHGVEIRGFFLGTIEYTFLSAFSGVLETKPAIVFMNEDGDVKINATCKFYEACKNFDLHEIFSATMTGIEQKGIKAIRQFKVYRERRANQ